MKIKLGRVSKPVRGFSHVFHIVLLCLLPIVIFILVRLRFVEVAIGLILLSKWRMIAVKPRHWLANIRANAVDMIVGLSLLVFMIQASSVLAQSLWALGYILWLVFIRPKSDVIGMTLQALIAQFVGTMAIFVQFGGSSLYILVAAGWLVAYMSARHFFASFEEPLNRFVSNIWGYFAASLIWLLGHWLLFYGFIAQPTALLSVIGFGLASIYFLAKTDKLSHGIRRQIMFAMVGMLLVILIFSDWGNKSI